jgi:DNA-binding transcriptional MerR regulator
MRLARTLLHFPYPGGKQPVLGLLERAKAGDLDRALQLAQAYLARVRAEQARADEASRVLERWAKSGGTSVGDAAQNDPPCSGDGDQRGAPSPGDVAEQRPRQIGETARLLAVTADMLRNWERNGLIMVPQNRQNGYRQYRSAEIARLRVIRVLRSAGYSTMAILRMLRHLDQKGDEGLRDVLDTPGPDEDVRYATDRWLSTLAEQEQRALDAIGQLDAMIRKRQSPDRTEP